MIDVISKACRLALVLCTALVAAGCYVRVRTVEVAELTTRATPVQSPLKVHLRDGSVVLFRNGAYVSPDSVRGVGERFDALQRSLGEVQTVSLDSVLGITNFWNGTAKTETVLLTMLATTAGTVGTIALLKAIFGSCPTFYTDSSGVAALEAEGFSYSIAPLFESRDLDALRGRPRAGVYSVEMRNEALETHYINHLELLVFEHVAGAQVLPDGRGNVTAVDRLEAPVRARDRSDRNVLAALASHDGRLFETAAARMRSARETDLMDHVDVDFGVAQNDSVAVTLRLRNSLLTTVLLYDVMLASAGAGALDWVAQDLEQVGNAAELGRWYVERMGLRVLVKQADGNYVEAGRIPDVGPIAWKDVAVMVAARKGEPLQVRIEFPADSWRIDRIALAQQAQRIAPVVVPAARVRHVDGNTDPRALNALGSADEAYLITEPGRRVFIDFDVAPPTAGRQQSFLLASQGYYSEWMRPDWLRNNSSQRFIASDKSLFHAMQLWRAQRPQLEQTFYATRIPTQ
ncbi:MAG TPA: hypothetical protein VGD27_13500 [Longimicrobiales bacterium]